MTRRREVFPSAEPRSANHGDLSKLRHQKSHCPPVFWRVASAENLPKSCAESVSFLLSSH